MAHSKMAIHNIATKIKEMTIESDRVFSRIKQDLEESRENNRRMLAELESVQMEVSEHLKRSSKRFLTI